MIALGLDVGGTSVKAAALDRTGDRAHDPAHDPAHDRAGGWVEHRSRTYTRPDRTTLLDALHEAAHRALAGRACAALGLCVPGRRAEASVERAVNVPGLEGLPFRELARRALDVPDPPPPRVTADAVAAASDYWQAERRPGRLLALVLGTGVGACVLDEGRVLESGAGGPGHFGQIDVGPCGPGRPPVGPDGGRGTLEAYVGAPALARALGPEPADWAARLDPGHPALIALARAIRIALPLYRPHEVALLGGVGLALRAARAALEEAVRDALTSMAPPGWRLGFGRTVFHAARGAAALAAAGQTDHDRDA